MTPEKIKEKVLKYKWELWVDGPFGAFMLGMFKYGQTRSYMKKAGVDAEWPAILFQNGTWYKSDEVWDIFEKDLQRYLEKGGNVFDVVHCCEEYLPRGAKAITELSNSKLPTKIKLENLYRILTQVKSWVWLAHGFEHLYAKVLRREVPKYLSGDVEKNIGDLVSPLRKTRTIILSRRFEVQSHFPKFIKDLRG